MSTNHLFKKTDQNAIKRFDNLKSNPKRWKKEEIKMDKLRNEFLLKKEVKELGFAFVIVNSELYCVNSLCMLESDEFRCTLKDGEEFTFGYEEIDSIEKMEE